MRICFLDIDGVLNYAGFGFDAPPDPALEHAFRDEWQIRQVKRIDTDLVHLLNKLQYETNCSFVLSSTWRMSFSIPQMNRMLQYRGFEGRLIGSTAVLSGHRGTEIRTWLRDANVSRMSMCILDDDSDMEPYMKYLVQTDYEVGLTEEHVERAIELLKGRMLPWTQLERGDLG